MNDIKRYFGIIWMLLSPALVFFMLWQAFVKIGEAPESTRANVALQWSIILLVFIPICIGFFMFGRYAWQNEYAHLPTQSNELNDFDEDPFDL